MSTETFCGLLHYYNYSTFPPARDQTIFLLFFFIYLYTYTEEIITNVTKITNFFYFTRTRYQRNKLNESRLYFQNKNFLPFSFDDILKKRPRTVRFKFCYPCLNSNFNSNATLFYARNVISLSLG